MYLFGFQRICSDSKEGIKKARSGMPSARPTTHIEGGGGHKCPLAGQKKKKKKWRFFRN
jgi:hypothetical protein